MRKKVNYVLEVYVEQQARRELWIDGLLGVARPAGASLPCRRTKGDTEEKVNCVLEVDIEQEAQRELKIDGRPCIAGPAMGGSNRFV